MAPRARSGISCARFLAMLADGRSPTATRMCIYGRRRRGRSVRCTDQTLRSPRYSVTSVSQPPTRWHAVASARCTLSRPTGCSPARRWAGSNPTGRIRSCAKSSGKRSRDYQAHRLAHVPPVAGDVENRRGRTSEVNARDHATRKQPRDNRTLPASQQGSEARATGESRSSLVKC